jgi:hypothetical protein
MVGWVWLIPALLLVGALALQTKRRASSHWSRGARIGTMVAVVVLWSAMIITTVVLLVVQSLLNAVI